MVYQFYEDKSTQFQVLKIACVKKLLISNWSQNSNLSNDLILTTHKGSWYEISETNYKVLNVQIC